MELEEVSRQLRRQRGEPADPFEEVSLEDPIARQADLEEEAIRQFSPRGRRQGYGSFASGARRKMQRFKESAQSLKKKKNSDDEETGLLGNQ